MNAHRPTGGARIAKVRRLYIACLYIIIVCFPTTVYVKSNVNLRYDDHLARDYLLMLCPLRRISAAYLDVVEFATERDSSEHPSGRGKFYPLIRATALAEPETVGGQDNIVRYGVYFRETNYGYMLQRARNYSSGFSSCRSAERALILLRAVNRDPYL